jgi:hypothetical protein
MSIDRYFVQIDSKWVRINPGSVDVEFSDFNPADLYDFWVDICHGANFSVYERYYFSDLVSALNFYLDGWRNRQYVGDDGKGLGLDHSGLYSRGRLIHGLSIHLDAPGHEGEDLGTILGGI